MARAALRWNLDDLARASGLGRATLARFELEQPVAAETVAKARAAFEREGVVFIERGVYIGGVVPPVGGQ
jgi:transcriptional regulator with XRE-family HTH domain